MANNGTGTGTLVLGALGDGGTAGTITKADSGALTLAAAATSLVHGTRVNVNGGTLNSNNAMALGAFAQVSVASGATFNLGASQQISSLGGLGSVSLEGNALTIGNSDNLSSTFAGTISGSGSWSRPAPARWSSARTNNYTGGTTISGGNLLVSGSLGNTAVSVNGGGALGGTGSIAGKVTLAGGSTPARRAPSIWSMARSVHSPYPTPTRPIPCSLSAGRPLRTDQSSTSSWARPPIFSCLPQESWRSISAAG